MESNNNSVDDELSSENDSNEDDLDEEERERENKEWERLLAPAFERQQKRNRDKKKIQELEERLTAAETETRELQQSLTTVEEDNKQMREDIRQRQAREEAWTIQQQLVTEILGADDNRRTVVGVHLRQILGQTDHHHQQAAAVPSAAADDLAAAQAPAQVVAPAPDGKPPVHAPLSRRVKLTCGKVVLGFRTDWKKFLEESESIEIRNKKKIHQLKERLTAAEKEIRELQQSLATAEEDNKQMQGDIRQRQAREEAWIAQQQLVKEILKHLKTDNGSTRAKSPPEEPDSKRQRASSPTNEII